MILGLIGEKGHGKDTVGNYLKEHHYPNLLEFNFADPMKEAVKNIFDFSHEQVHDQKLKETIDPRWGITPRRALEVVGTELFQYDIRNHIPELDQLGRTFWVYRFKIWYQKQINPKILIKDIRFPHEHNSLKEINATTIKIYNPNIKNNGNHASETEQVLIENYDYLIINNGTLSDLYKKIDKIMSNN